MPSRKRWQEIVFWSVLSAAFIGPGTVTLCSRAGAEFDFQLVWALLFSVGACMVLQEAVARVASVTGDDLGAALQRRFGRAPSVVVFVAVALGCAAYEAGNLLGALAGFRLLVPDLSSVWLLLIALPAALLLWFAATGTVARMLGLVVALMGGAFVVLAIGELSSGDALGSLVRGAVRPTLPEGSGWVALGLVGTTVVPYNLFLGSGLSRRRETGGLLPALALGGLVSLAVLVVGRGAALPFSFETLAADLPRGGRTLFAIGLAAAGFSSALTAPLAAALMAQTLFGRGYRAVWIVVLASGLLFGVSGIQPIPAIVAAQALNGMLLPGVALFVLVLANDRSRLGTRANGPLANLLLVICVAVATLLGGRALWAVYERLFL